MPTSLPTAGHHSRFCPRLADKTLRPRAPAQVQAPSRLASPRRVISHPTIAVMSPKINFRARTVAAAQRAAGATNHMKPPLLTLAILVAILGCSPAPVERPEPIRPVKTMVVASGGDV